MATPVIWNRGPWAPYSSLSTPQEAITGAPGQVGPSPEPGGPSFSSSLSGRQPAGFGPYGSTLSNMGDVALGALSGPKGVVRGAPAMASLVARAFGVEPEYNPYEGLISPEALSALRDLTPTHPDIESTLAEAAARTALGQPTGYGNMGVSTIGGLSTTPGWGSYREGERTAGDMGPGSMGDAPGSEAGGPEGSSSSGPGTGGTGGGYFARGGARTLRRRTQLVAGEAGPEQAIFIPSMMHRPGMQGNEPQVRRALSRAYRSLGPPRSMGR